MKSFTTACFLIGVLLNAGLAPAAFAEEKSDAKNAAERSSSPWQDARS